MTQLAGTLSREMNMPVEDATGLTGFFNFTLQYESGGGMPRLGDSHERAGADSNSPSIFVALPEQLGLKLEARKVPVEMLIIDHAERPSAN
jgi:uncharacterized protein (TIGR03435 family)